GGTDRRGLELAPADLHHRAVAGAEHLLPDRAQRDPRDGAVRPDLHHDRRVQPDPGRYAVDGLPVLPPGVRQQQQGNRGGDRDPADADHRGADSGAVRSAEAEGQSVTETITPTRTTAPKRAKKRSSSGGTRAKS